MLVRRNFVTFVLTLILLAVLPTVTLASTWTNVVDNSGTMLWTVYESGWLIPVVMSISGYWKEHWSGTPGGYAELTRLYHGAEVYNYLSIPFSIDQLIPSAEYNDGTTHNIWGIVYPYDWTLHNPDNLYNEGYNNPGTWYYNPNVTGYVLVYAPDTTQIQQTAHWHWVQ